MTEPQDDTTGPAEMPVPPNDYVGEGGDGTDSSLPEDAPLPDVPMSDDEMDAERELALDGGT